MINDDQAMVIKAGKTSYIGSTVIEKTIQQALVSGMGVCSNCYLPVLAVPGTAFPSLACKILMHISFAAHNKT